MLVVVRSEHVVAAAADGCSRGRAAVVGVCLEMATGGRVSGALAIARWCFAPRTRRAKAEGGPDSLPLVFRR